jgi:hypothetical protein
MIFSTSSLHHYDTAQLFPRSGEARCAIHRFVAVGILLPLAYETIAAFVRAKIAADRDTRRRNLILGTRFLSGTSRATAGPGGKYTALGTASPVLGGIGARLVSTTASNISRHKNKPRPRAGEG